MLKRRTTPMAAHDLLGVSLAGLIAIEDFRSFAPLELPQKLPSENAIITRVDDSTVEKRKPYDPLYRRAPW